MRNAQVLQDLFLSSIVVSLKRARGPAVGWSDGGLILFETNCIEF